MAGQFMRRFGDEGVEGLAQLGTSLVKAVKPGAERGNPGGDGRLVEVKFSGTDSASATTEKGMRYAQVASWSTLPATVPALSYTVSDGSLSVKLSTSYTGTITFWTVK